MLREKAIRRALGATCAVSAVVLALACSSKSSGGNGGTCASPGSAASGPADDHCDAPDGGQIVQVTTVAGCTDDGGAGGGGDDGGATGDDGGSAGDDGGAVDAGDIGNCGDDDYGATMYGTSGSDDDCKYNVSWTSTPICENTDVYFTVTATYRTDGSPLTGANARPDIVLDCTHSIPNTPKPADPSPENSPGVYTVGPVSFDKPGRWVVRFHFNETCLDIADDSPHGHAAFWVDVP
ncbi:MAG TPA: hypothetical protein VGG39_28050 [Polyangiaceae bacterium]|jgi:hypothetical protein